MQVQVEVDCPTVFDSINAGLQVAPEDAHRCMRALVGVVIFGNVSAGAERKVKQSRARNRTCAVHIEKGKCIPALRAALQPAHS